MKTLPKVLLLTLCAGWGALMHRVLSTEMARPGAGTGRVGGHERQARPPRTAEENRTVLEKLGKSESLEERRAVDAALAGLGPADFPALVAAMQESMGAQYEEGKGQRSVLLQYWAAADAAGLMAFVEKNGGDFHIERVVKECALYDPAAVLRWVRRMGAAKKMEKEELNAAWRDVLEVAEACGADPAPLLVAAVEEGGMPRETMAMSRVMSRVSRTVERWAKQDAAAAVAFAGRHKEYLDAALTGWILQDAPAALAWMKQNRTAEEETGAFQAALGSYAREHPREAVKLLTQLPDGVKLEANIAEGFIKESPLEALPYIEKANDNKLRRSLGRALAGRPPEEVMAVMKALEEKTGPRQPWEDASPREYVYDALCDELGCKDPAAALKLCVQWPDLLVTHSTDGVLRRYAHESPVAAAQWMKAGRLPDALRERLMPEVLDGWMVTDRTKALEFVEALPASEAKGRVLLEASRILDEGNRETAQAYAMNLTSVEERIGAFRRIQSKWYSDHSYNPEKTRPEEARWIAAIPDAAVRKALLPPPPEPVPESADFGDPFSTPPPAGP